MSIVASKQLKTQSPVNFIFVFLALLIALLVLVPVGSHLNIWFGGVSARLSAPDSFSFAQDLQYWNANCHYGLTTDATCKAITARAQSCSISTDSAYCKEYENYLEQFGNQ